ncbi:kelch domain-containing protein 2-like [Saccostrea echinata]|uniref:kelch domain-containing protein 2-like n=1 Tax=Saccostrea echinata TaxID=191078 RepID=UPI002A83B195|nr:kelch domain-containing protein 2-like [Saccostrea echinata]
MEEFNVFCISNVNDHPKQLPRREEGIYSQYIPTPVPEQLIIFGLGKWPSQVGELEVEVALTYKDVHLSLGMFTEQTRALCWERKHCEVPSIMSSEAEQGMAKLCIEFITSSTDSQHEKDLAKVKKENSSDKEINESTPKVSKKGKTKDASKPVKQKRRSSIAKGEKTPTGPTPKRSRTGKGKALNTDNDTTTDKENIATENGLKSSPETNKFTRMIEGGKPRVAICKDLTSRAPHPSSRWGHSMCMTDNNTAVVIGGQGERQQLIKDSVWCLNPVTRKWTCPEVFTESQKPEYRMGHTATYDPTLRCIYVYGGSKNQRWFHDVHMLDVEEWKWTLLKVAGKAPTRAYHSATLYRNELWIFGGVYPRPDPQPDGCSNEIHIFSPVSENWYQPIVNGEKPLCRSGHSATMINDQLVIFGGWDAPICYNDLHILDMCVVEWSKPEVLGTPPLPRSWHASCALANNRILIHGGYDGNLALEDTHIFNLGTLSWMRIRMDPTPIPRCGHQALSLPYYHENQEQDEVLIFGGGDNDGAFFHDLISASIPLNPAVDHTITVSKPEILENIENQMEVK